MGAGLGLCLIYGIARKNYEPKEKTIFLNHFFVKEFREEQEDYRNSSKEVSVIQNVEGETIIANQVIEFYIKEEDKIYIKIMYLETESTEKKIFNSFTTPGFRIEQTLNDNHVFYEILNDEVKNNALEVVMTATIFDTSSLTYEDICSLENGKYEEALER